MPVPLCPVCATSMLTDHQPWCYRCPTCGTWGSDLAVDINGVSHRLLDENLREGGLVALREHNNRVLVRRLREQGVASGSRLLDVGSAHGWFVRAACAAGIDAQGVEPDSAVAERARAAGTTVRSGFFPEVVGSDETFEAIAFNDVLEHLPEPRRAVAAARDHLVPGGLLSLNIPTSRGLFFRVASLVRRAGLTSPWERLWQVGMPSPHLWFFDQPSLVRLLEDEGFELLSVQPLDSISRDGLWDRAHSDRRPSVLTVTGVAIGWLMAPVLNHRRFSDVMHLVARRPAAA